MASQREKRDSRLELIERLFAGTGTTYDFMVNAATFGIDRLWKRRIAERVPSGAARILDLACGTGISTLVIARRHPQAQVIGVELREEYLQLARKKMAELGVRNVQLICSRAEDYSPQDPFDCVTSSYLAKYADLKRLIPMTHAMLNDGGLVLMHDFTYPPKRYLVKTWRVYFWVLQRLGSRLFPAWQEIFHGLPRLIEQTQWVAELQETLAEHGFRDIRREDLTLYGSAIVTARKAGPGEPTVTVP